MPVPEVPIRKDSRLFAEMCAAILRRGHQLKFRVGGHSMQPNLLDGDSVLVAPADAAPLRPGDIALVKNSDGLRVHRLTHLSENSTLCFTCSDTAQYSDPVATRVFGKVVSFSRNGQERSLSPWKLHFLHPLAALSRRIFLAGRRRLLGLFGAQASLLLLALAFFCVPSASAQNADLALTQSVVPTVVAGGNNLTYIESLTNSGPGSATSPVIYQQTPTNTTFVSITAPANWTCATPAVGATGQVICTWIGNGGVFTNGSNSSFTYVVQVNGGTAAGTTIVNSANATSLTTDGTPQNNATTTTVLVESATGADLSLSMTASPSPVFISSTLTYIIQVQNLGLVNAANVSVTDTIPAGATFVSATPSGSCTQTASVVCNLGTLANGASTTVTVVVTSPISPTTLSNTAAVSTSTADPVVGNNSATVATVVQPLSCATPGKDGNGAAITGVVNVYYPPSGATTLAAGSNSVTLGVSRGAGTAIAIGDLLLIIQMQDATIQSTNNSSYGDGLPGDPATGWLNLNSSGKYEFVTAASTVAAGGGTLTFTGTGAGGGALNTYTSAAYGTNGQKTFQVIRVPQYKNVILGAALTAASWNGATGGVLVIDVATQLNLNAGIATVSNLGFRGGAGRQLGGQAGALATDYITLATAATNGSKGEGTAGTPRYTANAAITNLSNSGVEGYPNGSYARGAPATAGAGATDANPPANNQNSGGGGGGNGGNGGYGGYGWQSAGIVGGHYGSAFPFSTNVLTMGGGGGAGTTNDGTANPANGNPAGINSSGSAGGGIIIVRAGSLVGTGTLTANGQNALTVENDGAGGGGAGGTIVVFSNSGGLTGLTVNAIGGNGGSTWIGQTPAAFPGNRHGPGGGGGGGAVLLSSSPTAIIVAGGTNGYSTTAQDAYGATPGQAGSSFANLTITQTPGTQSGAYCASTDLSVTNSGSPAVVAPGGNITYTQNAINNGAFDAVNAVFSESTPTNTTFQSVVPAAGWTCVTPAVGATGTITCTNPDFTAGTISPFTVVVQVGAGTTSGTQIVDVDNITSGTTDPNLANNSATAITTVSVSTSADLSVTNTSSAAITNAGTNVTMTGVVTNNGPATGTGITFSEPIPTLPVNVTFQSLTSPGGWNCAPLPAVGSTGGTITCIAASIASGGTATFSLVLGVPLGTASGTVITATDNISASTPDANPTNNSASATTVVATPGQIDLSVFASGTPNPVSQGNNITYTQTVTNNGPIAETNATFKVTIPANTTLVSFTPPANWTCNSIAVGGTGTFICTLNGGQTIASGASVNFPMAVNVNPATPSGTIITDTPSVSSTIGDPNAANNSATVNITVASPTQSDVSITKTAAPEPVNQGTNLVYSLMVTNGGPAVAQGVTVTDVIPAQVTYVSSSTAQGSCSYTSATTTVSCNLGNLGVGSSVLITINVTANSFSSLTLSSNTATVTSTTSDPNLANNSSTAQSSIQSPTAVDISSFRAFAQPDGSVSLEWRTQEESRNLGFHIYREQAAGRQRISPSLIAGSALLLRGSQPQHAAKFYRWVDNQPSASAAYWIEDVDINGTRTIHGPAYIESVSAARVATASSASAQTSPLLRELHPAAIAAASENFVSRPLATPRPSIPVPSAGAPRISVADHNAVKISVDHEGWYRVSLADLIATGLDPNTDLRSLRLFAEGFEQPLQIDGGRRNLRSPSSAIEFYGIGIDTPFSAERVYWLIRDSQPGKRISFEPPATSGTAAPNSFPFTVVREDRTTYFAALLNGENNDNFFGAVITSDPVDQDLEVAHIDPSSALPITLDLSVQGGTDGQDHRVSILFNGSNIGCMEFLGQALSTQTFNVPSSLLLEGSNTVTLAALNGDNDVSAVQSIKLHYPHTFVADGNWLRATVAPGSSLHISGFTDPQIQLFDITDPYNISAIAGKVSFNSGSYNVDTLLPGTGSADRAILAFSSSAISTPLSLTHHTPNFLDDRRRGADIIIISHPDFVSSLAPLVQLRQSQNHRVLLVTTDQLYDEYNFGERSPFAIRSFLKDAATHWRPSPQFVLLVGDASFDPRNYLGLGSFDFVPTRMIETAAFKTSSDDWFTDFQSNGYATLPTGRLPVRTAAAVQLVVSKIINYENGSNDGPWNSQALLVADQDANGLFASAVDSAAANLPASLHASEIFADGQDPATVRAQLLASLNSGTLLVNYHGHGAEQQWSFSNLFSNDDASTLTNGGRLPVYLLMDCLNGFFQDVYADSLAESLLLSPNGGAVAVWASSGFTDQAPQASMNLSFLAQFAAHPDEPLGKFILQAKSGTSDNDVRRSWILFGDPAMKIHFVSATPPANAGGSRAFPIIPRGISPVCAHNSACSKGKLPQ